MAGSGRRAAAAAAAGIAATVGLAWTTSAAAGGAAVLARVGAAHAAHAAHARPAPAGAVPLPPLGAALHTAHARPAPAEADAPWGELLAAAGDHRHQLRRRFGLFGPALVTELRADMLALDPAIDEYNSSRQVFDQIAVFAMLVAAVIGLLVLWDTAGLGACVGDALAKHMQQRRGGQAAPDAAAPGETGSLLNTFRGLAGSATAREPPTAAAAARAGGVGTSRSAPGFFGMAPAKAAADERAAAKDAAEYRPAGSAAATPTLAQRMGLQSMPSPPEDGGPLRDRNSLGAARLLHGLGLEVPWEPSRPLFFCLGFLSQLPLMIALCCYSFFATLFAGAGADGLSYFPVVVSVAQLIAAASVSTVLREWDWMVKAVVGLLISVPAVLVVPVCPPELCAWRAASRDALAPCFRC